MVRRKFHPRVYAEIVERQNGLCACGCGEKLVFGDFHFDHETPLHLDGEDTPENLRAIIIKHHLLKSTAEAKARKKSRNIQNSNGLMKKKPNKQEKYLARLLENSQ